jgi:DNA polymerase-4
MAMATRKIIHIDMDAFYASVEQRDNPDLRGKPVIVGGTPKQRGVVAACSYEARKFAIHSAMATATALRLCPQAVLVVPDFKKYTKASSEIHEIFRQYTDLVEPLSLDEAYLDVTDNKLEISSATQIAREIKEKIYEKTGLTASAGVSYCKFLAKIASGFKKPDGLTVVTPEKAISFIDKLPVGSFNGVGKVTEKKMHSLGIRNGLDLRKKSPDFLEEHFGKSGAWFYDLARGIDDSPVVSNWDRKSMGREETYPEDILDMNDIKKYLEQLCFDVEKDLRNEDLKGRTLTLKIKYLDFKQITRSVTIGRAVQSGATIYGHILKLLDKTLAGKKKIRLLGVSVHNFGDPPEKKGQLDLPLK